MLNIEYVRSLNSNYERIQLDKIPEERRYQYCILGRCRIRGLLSCSLRYINDAAYLYYDISSRQNISLLYSGRNIGREWIRDFVWSLKQVQQDLERFLLDFNNIVWYPEHIFQELEDNVFSFLYIPYYDGESGFMKLMEFWVEHIDYNDELLVECVYRMYERMERNGEVYLQSQIFEDVECLEGRNVSELVCTVVEEKVVEESRAEVPDVNFLSENPAEKEVPGKTGRDERKGILGIIEGKKRRGKKIREEYRKAAQQVMTGYAVAEEHSYKKSQYGQTVFIEEKTEGEECRHRLLTQDGCLMASLEDAVLTIGKKKEGVDLVLQDASVSRIHARIIKEEGRFYLEDLNSTNGTFRNGVRMQPYERKRLDEGDEIRCGKVNFVFR